MLCISLSDLIFCLGLHLLCLKSFLEHFLCSVLEMPSAGFSLLAVVFILILLLGLFWQIQNSRLSVSFSIVRLSFYYVVGHIVPAVIVTALNIVWFYLTVLRQISLCILFSSSLTVMCWRSSQLHLSCWVQWDYQAMACFPFINWTVLRCPLHPHSFCFFPLVLY